MSEALRGPSKRQPGHGEANTHPHHPPVRCRAKGARQLSESKLALGGTEQNGERPGQKRSPT